MASRAISRVLLILALVVTAHAFKPISGGSLIEQLLSTAESLSFVLPDFAEVRIAQASYLAAAFSQGNGRAETDSRFVESLAANTMPVVLAFGQSASSGRPAPCDKCEVAPTLARKRPVRELVAQTQPRLNQIRQIRRMIPELPEETPLSRAIALAIPLAEVELISLPVPRLSERRVLRRALFMPVTIKPMLPVLKQTKTDCDTNVIVAAALEIELSQNEGPTSEEVELGTWKMDVPVQAIESAETEPAANPVGRNCPVAFPETAIPPQPLEIAPPQ